MKNNKPVDEFLRLLFRNDILSLKEFEKLKMKIKQLQDGELIPNLITVKTAIFS